MRFGFTLDTTASPEQVLRAFTDTTPRRLETWRRTLDPRKYEVREVGETWAVVREGSPGPVWLVVRYDWSDPRLVRWTVLDSSFGGRGGGEIGIVPLASGGSRVVALFAQTRGPRPVGALILLLQRLLAPPTFPRLWKSALDGLAAREAA